MNLLIVDDSLVVRNAVARGAVRLFGAPLLAADGQQAVALFRQHRPELVTMDLTMPHLDGLGAISAILELEPVTSILVISALNSQAIALEAIQRGACGFLTKPFTEPEVRHALEQLVTHAHEHRR